MRHVLQFCPGTYHLYICWALVTGYHVEARQEINWFRLRTELFGGRLGNLDTSLAIAQARVQFVGKAFATIIPALLHTRPEDDDDPIADSLFEAQDGYAHRCYPR